MAVYSYILKNQYVCEECAKQMGREKNNKEWSMIKPEIKKCTLCEQKKDTYHSRYYVDIEDTVAKKGVLNEQDNTRRSRQNNRRRFQIFNCLEW